MSSFLGLELKRLTFHWSVSDRSQTFVAVKTSENAAPTDKRSKVKHDIRLLCFHFHDVEDIEIILQTQAHYMRSLLFLQRRK